MRHFVYYHSDLVTGEVFYIGHGTLLRSKSKRRHQDWKEKAALGYRVVLATPPISKEEAHSLEYDLIEKYKDQLVNKSITRPTLSYDYSLFEEYLYYDTTSPTRLRWKRAIGGTNNDQRKIGEVAGTCSKECRLTMQGKSYISSRIIWLLFHKEIDQSMVIDHIDGDRLNNSIENLRLISQKENMRNKTLCKKNVSGMTGVITLNEGGRQTGWRSQYVYHGKLYYQYYRFNKYIDEDFALELAKDWRASMMKHLIKLGETYTERHIHGPK